MTNASEPVRVFCCKPDNTDFRVTCGQGVSCGGECSAEDEEAYLCPSGNCTGICDIVIQPEEGSSTSNSGVTESLAAYKWCYPNCEVARNPGCCLNPACYDIRQNYCFWKDYLTGRVKCTLCSPVFLGKRILPKLL